MPTLVIKGKITKGYEHWVKVYDQTQELRYTKYGIKTIDKGHELEIPNTIDDIVNTPSLDLLKLINEKCS